MSKNDKQSVVEGEAWEAVLASLCRLQSVLPEAVLVGGTASALYAGHRLSFAHDHVLPDLRERFDAVLIELESVAGWETHRVKRPVLIPGSLDGVETGVRQLRRARPLETTVMRVGGHDVVLPTLPEVLRIKAFLCLERNAARDYLDLAALAAHMGIDAAGEALWRMFDNHGIIEAIERLMRTRNRQTGFNELGGVGLKNATFEAVVVHHPETFTKEAVKRATERLQE